MKGLYPSTICLIRVDCNMFNNDLDTKIYQTLPDLIIDKAAVRKLNLREARNIPSFVEEWLVSRYQTHDKTLETLYTEISHFMSKHLPIKTEKEQIKHRLQSGDAVVLLDRFSVRVNIKKNVKLLTIPSIDESSARVQDDVIAANEELLLEGQWGAGKLTIKQDKKDYFVELIEFKPMQSGKVKLDNMIQARKEFSTDEWIALLLRTMGYEPNSYTKEQQRHVILRLLPLVQNNLNMMELAPKGTGKSFIYNNLSRYVKVNSGSLTTAQLFKNMNTKELGLLGCYDLLVLDEGQSINFKGADDIHAKFKEYLESGHYSIGRDKVVSECGLMILANIDFYSDPIRPRRKDYIKHLPPLFHDDALLDRFHGIIPGWKIPRFTTESAAKGLGIKADVFGEYAHQIRIANKFEFDYGENILLKGDSRDVNAVTRISSALSKLLLLKPSSPEYQEYVLDPAIELRQRVREQLSELNPSEFNPFVNVVY